MKTSTIDKCEVRHSNGALYQVRNTALINPDYTPTALGCLVLAEMFVANTDAADSVAIPLRNIENVTIDQLRLFSRSPLSGDNGKEGN